MTILTRDNLQLSRPTKGEAGSLDGEINCKNRYEEQVSYYVASSLSPSSRRALAANLAHFHRWGGIIPATSRMVASYLAFCAERNAVATIARRLASIAKAHKAAQLCNPADSELVRATFKGIRRRLGASQAQALPLLRDDLFTVVDGIECDVRGLRDKALLLIGFAGGFRRSELVSLDGCHVHFVRQGCVLHLCRSKTDQEGYGRKIAVPYGRTRHCPVAALRDWMNAAGIEKEPLFKPIDRHGHIAAQRLSGEAVCTILRSRLQLAGFDPKGFSGHSLRAGFVTSASHAGSAPAKIRAQTGHASDAMLSRYIREGDLFTANAAGALL